MRPKKIESKSLSVRVKLDLYSVLEEMVKKRVAYNITHALEIVISEYKKKNSLIESFEDASDD